MVPRLRIANRITVRNLTILFIDLMWSIVVNDTHRLQDSTNTGDTVLLSLRECTVVGVSITVLRSTLVVTNSIAISPLNVVLFEIVNKNNNAANTSDVTLFVVNSTIAFHQVNGCCYTYNGNGSTLLNIYNDAASIDGVNVTMIGSNFSLRSPYQRYFGVIIINSGDKAKVSLIQHVTVSLVMSHIDAHMATCPDGCAASVSMYGAAVCIQADLIFNASIAVERAHITVVPASDDGLDSAASGSQMWVGAVTFVAEKGSRTAMNTVSISARNVTLHITATIGVAFVMIGEFNVTTGVMITLQGTTASLAAHGVLTSDVKATMRSSSFILSIANVTVSSLWSIDNVVVESTLAAGHPTAQSAAAPPNIGSLVGAAVILVGAMNESTILVTNSLASLNLTRGYVNRTFTSPDLFALDMTSTMILFCPSTTHRANVANSTVIISNTTTSLLGVVFEATVLYPVMWVVIITTSALTRSASMQDVALTFTNIVLTSDSDSYQYILPPLIFRGVTQTSYYNVARFQVNKSIVFDNSVFRAVDLLPVGVKELTVGLFSQPGAEIFASSSASLLRVQMLMQRVAIHTGAKPIPLQLIAPLLMPTTAANCMFRIEHVVTSSPQTLALLIWIGSTTMSSSSFTFFDFGVAATMIAGRGNLSLTETFISLRQGNINASVQSNDAMLTILNQSISGLRMDLASSFASLAPTFTLQWTSNHWVWDHIVLYRYLSYVTLQSLRVDNTTLSLACGVHWVDSIEPTEQALKGMNVLDSCTATQQLTQSTTRSRSSSLTLPIPLPGEAVAIQVARPVLGIASAAAVAAFLASGGAAIAAAADIQVLLTLGMSNCAPSVLKKSSDMSLYLLSPFYALGLEAMAFGNIGLFVVLWLSQLLAVRFLERKHGAPVARRVTNAPNPTDDVRRRLKYPNLTYAAGLLLLQGSLSAAMTLVMNRSGAGEIVAGAAALVLLSTGIALRVWAGRRVPLSLLVYSLYPMRVLRSVAWVPTWVLPAGEWTPQRLRETHGRFRSSVRGGAEWMCEYATIVSLCVAVIGALPVPEEQCYIVVPVLLFIVYAGTFALVARVQPARAPLANVLQICNYTVTLGIAVCMFFSGLVSINSTSDDASSASAAISALSFTVSVISCMKALHVLLIAWWLRQAQSRIPQGNHFKSVEEVGEHILGNTSRARTNAGLRSLIEMICLAKSKRHGLSGKKRPLYRSGIQLGYEWY